MKGSVWIFIFLFTAFSCKDKEAPRPGGAFGRASSFNANLSSSEPFSNYPVEYKAIYAAGARGAQTAAPWGSLNSVAHIYDFDPIDNAYFGLQALADYGYEMILFNMAIITINERNMPADIIGLAFDDPAVIARMHSLLDAINSKFNNKVRYLSFGNEVDTYFSSHPTEWTAYQTLVEDARTYVKTLNPALQVGVTTTFEGATKTFVNEVGKLNTNMDIVILTYYPIDAGTFVPRDPTTVKDDVASMIGISDSKPVIMQEWGYPSSAVLGSSEQKQADFYSNTFAELEKQSVINFPFVSFFKYRDWNSAQVQSITGQTAGGHFYEFMSSLGVLNNDGSTKAAFKIIEGNIK